VIHHSSKGLIREALPSLRSRLEKILLSLNENEFQLRRDYRSAMFFFESHVFFINRDLTVEKMRLENLQNFYAGIE
jgi:hypothetical protein